MLARVQKWGNSQGIRLSLKVLDEARMAVGDEVNVIVEGERIIVEPSRRVRGKYRLEDLVAEMPEGYEPQEEDWGGPVGREVW